MLRRKIDEVSAGRGVMPGYGVFPGRLTCADRLQEISHVHEGLILPIVLQMLDGSDGAGLHFALDHLGIFIVGVFQSARPRFHDPAIVFPHVLRVKTRSSSGDGEGALGAQYLKSRLG